MTGRLQGKRAFITAAAAGIGRETTLAFLREGAHVIATDRDSAMLLNFGKRGNLVLRTMDVTEQKSVDDTVSAAGRIDILMNAAGIVTDGSILDCTDADWANAFDVNVTGMFRTIRAALPIMLANGGGSIVNIASVVSSLTAAPRRFAYGASKAAVIGLTKSIATEFVAKGIRCNAICPGTIDTPSLGQRMAATGDAAKARASFMARQPMGRLGKAEEVAALAVHLASDESGFTTGQAYVIDGGWTI